MQINLTVFSSSSTVINNRLRFIAAETTAPSTPVINVVYDPIQVFPKSVTLTVPNPVPHNVRIYTTPDTSLGVLLADFLYDPSYQEVQVRQNDVIIVGRGGDYDPGDGATSFTIPDSADWTCYVERRANGGTQTEEEITIAAGGVFELVRAGDTFVSDEVIVVHYYPRITTATPSYTYLNPYAGVVTIDATQTLPVNTMGMLVQVASLTSDITLTMPAVADVGDLKPFTFTAFSGSQQQTTFLGPFIYNGDPMPAVYMGKNETFSGIKYGSSYLITAMPEGMFKVGRYYYMDRNTEIPNMLYCDGSGIFIAQWPRLDNYLSLLPTNQVYSSLALRAAAGIAGSTQWVRDTAAGIIYLPDRRGVGSRAAKDGRSDTPISRPTSGTLSVTGTLEIGDNKSHNHYTDSRFWNGVAMSAATNGQATPVVDNVSPDKELRVGEMNQASNIAGKTWWDLSHFINQGGVENTVNNWTGYIMVTV